MRRLVTSALGTAALLATSLTAAPAHAATSTTRIDGNHFAAGHLRVRSQSCAGPGTTPATPPKLRITKGPGRSPMGSRSVGWVPAVDGFGVGVMAHVDSPSRMTVLSTSVYAPEGHTSGQAVIDYVEPGRAGVWKGWSGLGPDSATGWHAVDAASTVYQWRHFIDGSADGNTGNATISGFAAAHGGDGTGAWVGFVFGCDGNPFYLDALHTETPKATRTYNLEGFRTRSSIAHGKQAPARLSIVAGKSISLTAQLRRAVSGTAISGPIKLQSRPLSGKKWFTIDHKLGSSGSYAFKARPFKSIALRMTYAGTAANQASTSHVLKVLVRSYVAAHLVRTTVTRGHAFTVAGRVLPGRKGRIALQRFAGGHWKTVRTGSSNGQGRFSISATSGSVGRSYWRVTVAPGGNNILGKSPWLKLTTVAPPSGGGSTPPPPSDPPPPPPDDPPPPPPSH